MANDNLGQPLRWYQRFGGVMMVSVFASIIAFILLIVGATGYYYWQIKQGNGQVLFEKFYGGISVAVKNNTKSGGINRSELEIANAPFLGNNNAKVTIVEFVDFKCPYTKAEAPILREVMQKYGNKVKLIIRNFPPSDNFHPGANQFANIAMCAYQQGYYWPLHDWFFEQQENLGGKLSETDIEALGAKFGWDVDKMNKCLADQNTKVAVNKDFADGYRFGISGTPTFFINGEKVEGVIPFSAWELFLNNIK
ncbi:MAG: DsbA oxidoreductase [uncultured bacterium]|nr:MAG: DsbA oxidoreductase [uncultured bacterium]